LHVHVNTLLATQAITLQSKLGHNPENKNTIHNMNNTDTFVRPEVFTVLKINTAGLVGHDNVAA